MLNNLELIKPLLKFESEDDYYFLQILQRKKDVKVGQIGVIGSNNSSRLIKAYFVSSIEYLDQRWDEIVKLCELFNARAMITLNKRSYRASSLQMMVQLAQSIQSNNFNNYKMWNNVAGKYQPIHDKTWIIDLDGDDLTFKSNIVSAIQRSRPHGKKIIAEIPSKNGVHLITSPFDVSYFKVNLKDEMEPYGVSLELEIHKNNPTNLYIP